MALYDFANKIRFVWTMDHQYNGLQVSRTTIHLYLTDGSCNTKKNVNNKEFQIEVV